MTRSVMRSHELDLSRYDTDKVAHRYLEWYDPILAPWVEKPVRLLELGVYRGGSLLLWRDYFPHGTIVGIDLRLSADLSSEDRIHTFEGSQADRDFLTQVATRTAPEGFDIIIDDASHIGRLTRISFWHLLDRHLKPGGLYFIEDWGTGYFRDWPDGKEIQQKKDDNTLDATDPVPCHSYGMVGFVKELVDEQGAHALTAGALSRIGSGRASKFASLLVLPSFVVVTKA